MPYVKNPITYPSGKVSEETAKINTNFSILADAFYNSDPENSPIYRACYVGITAPLNPKVGQIWVDTSVAPPVIKVYNGTNWLEVKPASVDEPSTPYIGQLWLDTSGNPPILKIYDGTNWQSNVSNANYASNADKVDGQDGSYYLNRANHTGTQPPSTISPQGHGSGLNADMLDGYHIAPKSGWGGIPYIGNDGVMEVGKYIDFHLTPDSTAGFELRLEALDPNNLAINSNKIWHEGNDGHGSGLDADKVDGFNASQTPGPNVIPVAASSGKLDVNWIPSMFNSVQVITPSKNTIYRETAPCLIMVVSQDLGGLEISPDGTTWYGKFGQEHYANEIEGGTITFFVPKNWYWRYYSSANTTTNPFLASFYWLKFILNY